MVSSNNVKEGVLQTTETNKYALDLFQLFAADEI